MDRVTSEVFENFLACKSSRGEARLVVRHLLSLASKRNPTAALLILGREFSRRPAPGPAAYSLAFTRAEEKFKQLMAERETDEPMCRTILE